MTFGAGGLYDGDCEACGEDGACCADCNLCGECCPCGDDDGMHEIDAEDFYLDLDQDDDDVMDWDDEPDDEDWGP